MSGAPADLPLEAASWTEDERTRARRLAEGELTGRALACWCNPLPCHADVLAARIEELNGQASGTA